MLLWLKKFKQNDADIIFDSINFWEIRKFM